MRTRSGLIAFGALSIWALAADAQSTAPLWSSGEYRYDGAGNITAIGTAAVPNSYNRQCTFAYDLAGRLTAATVGHSSGSLAETYEYDGFGNLKKRTIGGQPDVVPDPDPATNRNREGVTAYDVAGNVIRRANNDDASYDAFNQIGSLTTASGATQTYIYTATDERIAVDTGASVHWTIRDFDNKPIRQFDSGLLTGGQWSTTNWTWNEDYVWSSDGKLLASQRPSALGGRRHFHLDHLGSTRVVTDSSGTLLFVRDYSPYGNEITPLHTDERMAFTGHERDYDYSQFPNANAIDYMHARYYDSRIGRFLAVDTARGNPRNLRSWNRFTYVGSNPLSLLDESGLSWLVYNDKDNSLSLFSKEGNFIGTWKASNNIASGSSFNSRQRSLDPGSYRFKDQDTPNTHGARTDGNGVLQDSRGGAYGSGGIFRLKDFTDSHGIAHQDVGIHAGREDGDGLGWTHPTYGCIRTTEDGFSTIANTAASDPLDYLYITGPDSGAAGGSRWGWGEERYLPGSMDPSLFSFFGRQAYMIEGVMINAK